MGVVFLGGRADGPYRAGTLAEELGPERTRTLGCLDLALAMDADLLDVHVGNRCGHPEVFDLSKVAIDADPSRDVSLDDPRSEIVPLHVGGAERGHERVRLVGAWGASRLCFRLEGVAPDAPDAHPSPICIVP